MYWCIGALNLFSQLLQLNVKFIAKKSLKKTARINPKTWKIQQRERSRMETNMEQNEVAVNPWDVYSNKNIDTSNNDDDQITR